MHTPAGWRKLAADADPLCNQQAQQTGFRRGGAAACKEKDASGIMVHALLTLKQVCVCLCYSVRAWFIS